VASVRARDWNDVRAAYVSITGDNRDNVDEDAARNVVAGELQKHWADCQNRQDLKPVIEEQPSKRIEFALQDPPVTPTGSDAAHGRKPGGRSMATKKEKKDPSEKKASTGGNIPQRGASGLAAKLIQEGDTSKESVTKKVQEAFPNV